MSAPLADRLRPTELSEVCGQQHILGEGKLLRKIADSGTIPNLIFFGPSGTGKTTVARIIAKIANKKLCHLNGTSCSTADIKEVFAETAGIDGAQGVLLYLDEIQYLNKKQQQTLLEFIEDGRVTLIASTTENPYFYVYNALLSRSTVFEFKQVPAQEIEKAVSRAIQIMSERYTQKVVVEENVVRRVAMSCGGDVRKSLNAVELLFSAAAEVDGQLFITEEDAKAVAQKSAMRYDREGDDHFDILSALMKSLRGSDPDAALHYLARMLEAGDLPSTCRRILASACEDVGLAYPQIIPIVKACVDSALMMGLPEGRLPLADAVILIATSPKSNVGEAAIDAALADVRAGKTGPIPRHLQNVHADGTGFEREQGYLYPHNYPGHWVKQQYLPDELVGTRYYYPADNRNERAAAQYWEKIKGGL